MKTGTALLLLGGGALVWYYANLGIAGNTVNIVFDRVNFNSIRNFDVILTVQNVSNATVKINSMTGTVYLNGNSLANISDFTQRTVNPNSQLSIAVNVKPDFLNLGSNIMAIISDPSAPLRFTIEGNANINNLVLPFSLENDVNI